MVKILVVDDNPDILEIVMLSLGLDEEFEVRTADSGTAALAILAEAASWRPDLVILDFMMPGLTGPETFAEMRKNTELDPVRVVFLTARVQPAEQKALMDLGAHGVLAKPFDPLTLAQTVRTYATA